MKEDSTAEEWRDVAGYEGYYQASNLGRIKSLDREVPCSRHGVRKIRGKLMTPAKATNGYFQVGFRKEGVKNRPLWHRVIALTFIPKVDGKTQINHKNGDISDNRVCNLEWCTASENTLHAHRVLKCRHGMTGRTGYKNSLSIEVVGTNRMTGQTVRFGSSRDAARQMGVHASGIVACLKGRQKTCNGFAWEYAV